MTSNASPPPPGGPAGRRRALGRGPGAPPAEPREAEPPTSLEEADPAAPPVERAGSPEPLADGDGTASPVGVAPAGPTSPVAEPGSSHHSAGHAASPTVSPAGSLGHSVDGDGTVPPVELRAETVPNGPAPATGGVAPAGVTSPVAEPARPVSEAARSLKAAVPGPVDTPSPPPPAGGDGAAADDGVFKVRLANFEGPFDLLLQLISRHKMDVTEVALSKVTDEFMAHIRAMGPDWDLDETTEFLVVAATLLDLKAARLLPAAEVEDEGDLALLEARDLLFARLLQYRAYKQIADIFSGRLDDEARRYPRTVGLEAHHAELLPDVVISIGAEGFAKLAVKAMQPKPKPQVYVDHIHAPLVSVQEQAQIVVARLRELGEASFRALVEDTDDTLTVVARFLALLELYREKAVALEQETALGDLLVRWTGGDGDETPTVTDEFDRPPEPPKEEKKA